MYNQRITSYRLIMGTSKALGIQRNKKNTDVTKWKTYLVVHENYWHLKVKCKRRSCLCVLQV